VAILREVFNIYVSMIQLYMSECEQYFLPCIRLARGKFELTNHDSAGGNNSSVLM